MCRNSMMKDDIPDISLSSQIFQPIFLSSLSVFQTLEGWLNVSKVRWKSSLVVVKF